MPRAKLTDTKPRGRMSAYAFFVQTCREEHKVKHPDENVVFAEFSRKCAERWKTMTDKEKQKFNDMAEKDKMRYVTEMEGYKGPKNRGRKRRQRKDPNAPKRPLSAFFWFCNDERPLVRADKPELGVGEIAKECASRWSSCNDEDKAKYEAMAEKDRSRYEEEMAAYRKGTFGVKKVKTNNTHEEGEMDEEESEEEEDEEEEGDE